MLKNKAQLVAIAIAMTTSALVAIPATDAMSQQAPVAIQDINNIFITQDMNPGRQARIRLAVDQVAVGDRAAFIDMAQRLIRNTLEVNQELVGNEDGEGWFQELKVLIIQAVARVPDQAGFEAQLNRLLPDNLDELDQVRVITAIAQVAPGNRINFEAQINEHPLDDMTTEERVRIIVEATRFNDVEAARFDD